MLQFMGSQRVRHDCETNISFYFLLCPYSVFISTVSFLSLCVCVQSHLTFCDTMDWSLPGSWTWDYPGKNNGASCHFLLQGIYPTQGSNLCLLWLLHYRRILYHQATGEAQFSIFKLLLHNNTNINLCSYKVISCQSGNRLEIRLI